MGFFDDLKPPPRPEESEEGTPNWISAPDAWIGAVLPLQELIGRSQEAAIALARIVAHPVGFEATLDAFTRAVSWGWAFDVRIAEWHRGEHERPPGELLRYRVELADGRKASTLGGMLGGTVVAMPAGDDKEPDPANDIRFVPGGGHGGGRHSRQEVWICRCRLPGRSRSSANGRGTESPRAGSRSRPLRSAVRRRRPLRSGLRPSNNETVVESRKARVGRMLPALPPLGSASNGSDTGGRIARPPSGPGVPMATSACDEDFADRIRRRWPPGRSPRRIALELAQRRGKERRPVRWVSERLQRRL